jgi:hypothetical protein
MKPMKRVLVSTLGVVAAYCGFVAVNEGVYKVRASPDGTCECTTDEVGDYLCDLRGGGGHQCYDTPCTPDQGANGMCDLIGAP